MRLNAINAAINRLFVLGGGGSPAWSPLSLWPDGIASPGMWISPRTLNSQWQDYTGTTPVSIPGTVADTSNPVGLALDIRAGATVLTDPGNHMLQSTSAARPLMSARVNLLTYTEGFTGGAWGPRTYGSGTIAITPNYSVAPDGTTTACRVLATAPGGGDGGTLRYEDIIGSSVNLARSIYVKSNTGVSQVISICAGLGAAGLITVPSSGWTRFDVASSVYSYFWNLGIYRPEGTDATCDISIWHPQLQIGTTATPYQSVPGDGSTYATDFPIFQKYDGVDDGMATASFAAGTLTSGMDCMIAVRRDSGTTGIVGLSDVDSVGYFFGFFHEPNNTDPNFGDAGTPTTWMDGAQLAGGTATTRATLYNALTAGEWHIVEWRGLDLSGFTAAVFSAMTGGAYRLNGARGDIMLFPSTASTEDKDAARQYLADYYGVTLP